MPMINLSAIADNFVAINLNSMGEEIVIDEQYICSVAIAPSAKQMFNFNSRTYIFTGEIALPEGIPYYKLKGLYFTKETNPSHIFLIEEIIPSPLDITKLAVIKANQCNEEIEILDVNENLVAKTWAYFQTRTNQQQQTPDGNINRDNLDVVLPVKYGISEGYKILRKNFINGVLGIHKFNVDSVDMNLIDWTEFENDPSVLYGVVDCRLRFETVM